MKIFEKIKDLNIYIKFAIILFVAIFIAVINFLFYNYQSLKSENNRKTYNLNFSDVQVNCFKEENDQLISTCENAYILFDLNNSYTKNVIVEYESANDFGIVMNANKANEYGVLKHVGYEEKANSKITKIAFPFNQKVSTVQFNFSLSDVQVKKIIIDNSISFNWVTFVFWLIIVELIVVIFLFQNYFYEHMHILAFILCMSLGTIYITASHNMTTTTLDDETHFSFYNYYAKKNNYTEADYIMEFRPITFEYQNTKDEIDEYQDLLNKSSKVKYDKSYSYNYKSLNENLLDTNKLNYFPLAVFFRVSSSLNIKYTTRLLIARILKLICYSVVIMLAVKRIPIFKLLVALIAIIPQSLFLATNFNYDPVVNMFLIYSFAIFVDEYYNKKRKLTFKTAALFLLSSIIGIFPKAVYAPVVLVALLLPKEKFENVKQMKRFRVIVVGIFVACMLTFILPLVANPSANDDYRGGNTSALAQTKMIVRNPVSFVTVFWREAILKTANRFVSPSTIGILSYYGTMDSDTSYLLIWLAILIAAVAEKNKQKIKTSHRVIMIFVYAITMCFIWGSMYLGFTPVGENVINGVQHRYFLPFFLPLIYFLLGDKVKCDIDSKKLVFITTVMFIIAYCLTVYNIMILRFFI